MLPSSRRAPVVVLPWGCRRALEQLRRGAKLDAIVVDLLRRDKELLLFRVRLPPRDRRCGQIRRLIHAVRLRSF